jgi:hypothetical protein
MNLIDIIRLSLSKLTNFSRLVQPDTESLNIHMVSDQYLWDVFYEILHFILSFDLDEPHLKQPVTIRGKISIHLTEYCVIIEDSCTPPISKDICQKLAGTITDQWEYQGHYIGISLASVIMQHYGGVLEIQPAHTKGNSFTLHFPLTLVESYGAKT